MVNSNNIKNLIEWQKPMISILKKTGIDSSEIQPMGAGAVVIIVVVLVFVPGDAQAIGTKNGLLKKLSKKERE